MFSPQYKISIIYNSFTKIHEQYHYIMIFRGEGSLFVWKNTISDRYSNRVGNC